ncbi:hypothetical protein Q5P01_001834 [Channa striata]|uniref:LRRNT domain-containing protein n=1 Tax=Channa striata TaxID=64152 RepID=A0AA88NRP5_CHASR|nr:hypothetical protein Q5P01_001834 [Channa striata]
MAPLFSAVLVLLLVRHSAADVSDMDYGGVPLWINRFLGEPSVLSLQGRMDPAWFRANNPQACPLQCECPIQWPTALYCDHRGLADIPDGLPDRTQYLFLQRNNISSLSSSVLANVTKLHWLILDHNQLQSAKLDQAALQNQTKLYYLFANHNYLSSVPSTLPSGLRQLRLAHNQISSISSGAFEKLLNLTLLLLQGNRLQTITEGDLKGLLSLNMLDLSGNNFLTVPRHLPASIEQLYLSNNSLSGLDRDSFVSLLNLKYLRLSHCGLQSSSVPQQVFNISSLVELDLSYNKLITIPTVPTTLQYMYLEANEIQGTRGRTMKAGVGLFSALALFLLMGAVFTQRNKPKKPTRRPATTRKPSVPKPAVPAQPEPQEPTDFPPPILGPPSIYPDCPRECLCSPSYPNSLNCENRNIRVIPVIPSRTHYLYLQNNYISEVTAEAFVNATEVRWINFANNRIHRIDKKVFDKIPSLLYLYVHRNQLKEVPAGLPASLEQLRLSKNRITKIPAGAFNKMENLTLLDLYHNQLSDSDLGRNTFRDLKSLMQLNLAHNILKKMPDGVPNGLIQLFLDRNRIDDIPKDYFKGFTHLAFVRLNYNQLSDKGVPKAVFNISSLLDLQLAHNQLASLPLFNGNLEHLHLNHNNIESINGTLICPFDLHASLHEDSLVPKLRYLRLDGNHLSPPIPLDIIMCFRHLHSIVI